MSSRVWKKNMRTKTDVTFKLFYRTPLEHYNRPKLKTILRSGHLMTWINSFSTITDRLITISWSDISIPTCMPKVGFSNTLFTKSRDILGIKCY